MREETNYKSYRDWLKKQMVREKHEKYNNYVRKQELIEREKEDRTMKNIDA